MHLTYWHTVTCIRFSSDPMSKDMDVSSDHVPKDAEDEDEVKNLVVDDENDKTVVPCIAISEDLGDIQVSVEGNMTIIEI